MRNAVTMLYVCSLVLHGCVAETNETSQSQEKQYFVGDATYTCDGEISTSDALAISVKNFKINYQPGADRPGDGSEGFYLTAQNVDMPKQISILVNRRTLTLGAPRHAGEYATGPNGEYGLVPEYYAKLSVPNSQTYYHVSANHSFSGAEGIGFYIGVERSDGTTKTIRGKNYISCVRQRSTPTPDNKNPPVHQQIGDHFS